MIQRVALKNISDIRFWIVFFFIIRLWGITNPPIEFHHNWRQATTLVTTRHFYNDGPDFFHPKTDIAGADRSNVIASEFPVYNYLIYLSCKVFGYDHWYGRLINLLVSSIGLYFLYLILKRVMNEKIAFYAVLLSLSSVWFMFSRKIMPDTFSVSIMIAAVWFSLSFLEKKKIVFFIAFVLLGTIAILSKMPVVVILFCLWPVVFLKQFDIRSRVLIAVGTGVICTSGYLWYYWWVPELLSQGAMQLYFPRELHEGLKDVLTVSGKLFERFYFSAFYSYMGFGVSILGIVLSIKNKWRWNWLFLSVLFVLVFFILKTGSVFALHDYYMIPFLPFLAIYAGYALAEIKMKQIVIAVASIVMIEGFLNQQHDLAWYSRGAYKLNLEAEINAVIEPGLPIAFISEGSPNEMYFANRSGWLVGLNQVYEEDLITRLKNEGCNYIILIKEQVVYRKVVLDYPIHFETNSLRFYRIN